MTPSPTSSTPPVAGSTPPPSGTTPPPSGTTPPPSHSVSQRSGSTPPASGTTPPAARRAQPPQSPSGVVPAAPSDGAPRTIPVTLLGGRALLVSADAPARVAIAEVARAQHGAIGRGQLRELGLSGSRIRRLQRDGTLHSLHAGVYAVGHLAAVPMQREAAAALALGPRAWISHRSALRIVHALPPDVDAPIDVVVGARRGARAREGIRVHRTRWLPHTHVRLVEGIPATDPERALLDSAPLLTARELERALDEALARRLTSLTKVSSLVSVAFGQPGQGRLARLLEDRSWPAVTRSEAEERFLMLIRAAELPEPQLQANLLGFSVDAYWPEARLAIEIDGYQWHATKTKFERDRRKDLTLQSNGITLIRITWRQITEEPLPLVSLVSGRLASAGGLQVRVR